MLYKMRLTLLVITILIFILEVTHKIRYIELMFACISNSPLNICMQNHSNNRPLEQASMCFSLIHA